MRHEHCGCAVGGGAVALPLRVAGLAPPKAICSRRPSAVSRPAPSGGALLDAHFFGSRARSKACTVVPPGIGA
eukprot:2344067-Heterocapsa_arctica.AAC.1